MLRLFEQDISDGLENVPIVVESSVSKDAFNFKYSPENVQGPGCEVDPSEVTLPGCPCRVQSCTGSDCPCLQPRSLPYDSAGRLMELQEDSACYSQPVFECNALCCCGDACVTRVVQKGVMVPMGVCSAGARGLGVRALEPIRRGTFVCEYAGEVLGFEEARRRQLNQSHMDRNYIIAVQEHAGEGQVNQTFVDPVAIGNVGRFLNHSCQPNLVMVPVRVHSLVPRLALFANCDIPAYEELTFDYTGGSCSKGVQGSADLKTSTGSQGTDSLLRKPCLCGAQSCTGFLPLDISVLQ